MRKFKNKNRGLLSFCLVSFKLSYKFDAAILIVLAVGAGYFVYAKEFRQKDCGCGSGKACGSKGKIYD
nr:hypothetical protein [uncultured Campylobacter sp.]